MTVATADPSALEAIAEGLTADQLAQLGASFTARAVERRRTMAVDECRAAVASAPLTPAWEKSQFPNAGRVRIACRILVSEYRLHPE